MEGDPARALLERLRFLGEIGVDSLRLRSFPSVPPAAEGVTPELEAGSRAPGGRDLAAIRREMGECSRCGLSASRTRIVFGVGDPGADLMFIGEAPGLEEDRRGEPFVGRAGQLLDRMIVAIGLQRQQVYIANIVKCRPPNNRNPREGEMQACAPFLAAQVEAVAPKVIVALGKVAASALLGEEIAITRARGRWRSFGRIPLMPTFHPAFLLRRYTPENRRAVYDDLLQVRAILDGTATP